MAPTVGAGIETDPPPPPARGHGAAVGERERKSGVDGAGGTGLGVRDPLGLCGSERALCFPALSDQETQGAGVAVHLIPISAPRTAGNAAHPP